MSGFLEIAIGCTARGWFVFPCKGKRPLTAHGFKDASTDEAQIREWWTRWPEANVAIACGASNLAVMDSDHGLANEEEFKAWLEKTGLPPTFTVRTGRRPEFGVQMYFDHAIADVGLWQLEGCEGQIKSAGGYVMAAGSIHPDSKEVYQVLYDLPIVAIPNKVRELKTFRLPVKIDGPMEKIPEGAGRHAALISVAGKLRASGLDGPAILAALTPLNESMCAVPLPYADLEHMADSASKWSLPKPAPEVYIGTVETKQSQEEIEEFTESEASLYPKYPLEAWEGTPYLEFALKAASDNFVPPEIFLETAITFAGAIAARHLGCTSEEVNPRLYTVIIAPPGTGKGTSQRRTINLMPPERVVREINKEKLDAKCRVLLSRAASENGLNDSFLEYPSVLSDFEEMDAMMEKTGIKGSGKSMMSVIRSCFDGNSPGLTKAGKTRPVVAEIGYLSLIGGMTPQIWRRSLEGADSYGTGLGGRFNLVASGEVKTAAILTKPDFGPITAKFERLFSRLDAEVFTTIPIEPAAARVLSEWWGDKGKLDFYNRVNVISARKALHLAWSLGLPTITVEVVHRALKLAEYLASVRAMFVVAKGEEKTAIAENRVLDLLRNVFPKALRPKRIVELLDETLSRATVYRALQSLASTAEVSAYQMDNPKGGGKTSLYRAYPRSRP